MERVVTATEARVRFGELMRRVAQASIARDGGMTVETGDISEALDDMLFAGGKLNVKLLGGALEMAAG